MLERLQFQLQTNHTLIYLKEIIREKFELFDKQFTLYIPGKSQIFLEEPTHDIESLLKHDSDRFQEAEVEIRLSEERDQKYLYA